MAEHHLGAIDFELSKFKNKSRIEGLTNRESVI